MGHYEHQRRQDTPELEYGKGEREGASSSSSEDGSSIIKMPFCLILFYCFWEI